MLPLPYHAFETRSDERFDGLLSCGLSRGLLLCTRVGRPVSCKSVGSSTPATSDPKIGRNHIPMAPYHITRRGKDARCCWCFRGAHRQCRNTVTIIDSYYAHTARVVGWRGTNQPRRCSGMERRASHCVVAHDVPGKLPTTAMMKCHHTALVVGIRTPAVITTILTCQPPRLYLGYLIAGTKFFFFSSFPRWHATTSHRCRRGHFIVFLLSFPSQL